MYIVVSDEFVNKKHPPPPKKKKKKKKKKQTKKKQKQNRLNVCNWGSLKVDTSYFTKRRDHYNES